MFRTCLQQVLCIRMQLISKTTFQREKKKSKEKKRKVSTQLFQKVSPSIKLLNFGLCEKLSSYQICCLAPLAPHWLLNWWWFSLFFFEAGCSGTVTLMRACLICDNLSRTTWCKLWCFRRGLQRISFPQNRSFICFFHYMAYSPTTMFLCIKILFTNFRLLQFFKWIWPCCSRVACQRFFFLYSACSQK